MFEIKQNVEMFQTTIQNVEMFKISQNVQMFQINQNV